jgi:hypothetical protein
VLSPSDPRSFAEARKLSIEGRRAVDHFRALDLERLEDLIARYMPVALGEDISPEKSDDEGLEVGIRAAEVVLKAIRQQATLLGLGDPGRGKNAHGPNVLGSLQDSLPSVAKLVASAALPAEVPEVCRGNEEGGLRKASIEASRTSLGRPF